MRMLRYRARSDLRRSTRFLLVVGLVAGLVAGVVLAAVLGARRNATAFPRLVRETRSATVLVNPDRGPRSKVSAATILRLPDVDDVGRLDGLLGFLEDRSGHVDFATSNTVETLGLGDGRVLRSVEQPKIYAGSLPHPDDPVGVFVSSSLARRRHLRVGSTLVVHPGHLGGSGFKLGRPVRMRVAGIGRISSDIVAADAASPARIFPSRTYDRQHRDGEIYFGYFVRLRNGSADLPTFRAQMARAYPKEGIEYQTIDQISATVHRATVPGTTALLIFAVVLGITALIGVAQAVVRHIRLHSADLPTLRTLGMRRGEIVASQLLLVAAFSSIVALVSVPTALALSSRFPIGPGRIAEPSPGTAVNVLGLILGALLCFGTVLLASAPGVVRTVRTALTPAGRSRPSTRFTGWLRAVNLGLVPTLGVDAALGPNVRPSARSRSMLVGVTLGVSALIAALVFAANLDRLVATPARYGWAWDASIGVSTGDLASPKDIDQLEHGARTQHWVQGAARVHFANLDIDSRSVPALGTASLRGGLNATIISGRAPTGSHQIALGRRTLKSLHAHVGDVVHVKGPRGRTTNMKVVGVPAFPALSNYSGTDSVELGGGALVTQTALRRTAANYDPADFDVVIKATSDARLDAFLQRDQRLFDAGEWTVYRHPLRPTDVVGLTYVQRIPTLLALVLAALGMAMLINVLLVSLRARRTDIAILKSLGFVRRDLMKLVAWEATAFALVAVVGGVFVGIVTGRLAWTAVANQVGVVADTTTPILLITAVAISTLVIANLTALWPGMLAAGTPVDQLLRAE